MAQQVVRGRTQLISTSPNIDTVSFDTYWEVTGADTMIDWADSKTPSTVIQNFLNNLVGPHNPIAYYLANELSRTAGSASTTYTDITDHLDGSPAGSPFRTDTFTLGPGTSSPTLPADAAALFSYRADYGTTPEHGPEAELPTPDDAIDYGAPPTHMGKTRPRARMRGRIYIGPLSSSVALGASAGLLNPYLLADLQAAGNYLLQDHLSGFPGQFEMRVWSRRDAAVYDPTNWFVSEAFATVRKRGDVSVPRVHNWSPVTGAD